MSPSPTRLGITHCSVVPTGRPLTLIHPSSHISHIHSLTLELLVTLFSQRSQIRSCTHVDTFRNQGESAASREQAKKRSERVQAPCATHTEPPPGPLMALVFVHSGHPRTRVVISGGMRFWLGAEEACTKERRGSRFIEKKKKSSQYGPYLPASFRALTRICRISGTHMHGNSASHNDTSPALFLREPPREGNSHRLLEDLKKSGIHKFQVCGKDGAQVECRQCQASPSRAKAASGAYSAAETTVLSCAESAFKWF